MQKTEALNPASFELAKYRIMGIGFLITDIWDIVNEFLKPLTVSPDIEFSAYWHHIYYAMYFVSNFFGLCALYFCCCNRGPGKKSKLKLFFQKLASGINLVPKTATT